MEINPSPIPVFALYKMQPSLLTLNLTLCDQKNSQEPGNNFWSNISLAQRLLLIIICHLYLSVSPDTSLGSMDSPRCCFLNKLSHLENLQSCTWCANLRTFLQNKTQNMYSCRYTMIWVYVLHYMPSCTSGFKFQLCFNRYVACN